MAISLDACRDVNIDITHWADNAALAALGARWRYLVDATMSAAQASARAARWRVNAQAWRGTEKVAGDRQYEV